MKFILYIQLRAYLNFPIKKHNQVIFAFSLVRQLATVLINSDRISVNETHILIFYLFDKPGLFLHKLYNPYLPEVHCVYRESILACF